MRYRIKEVIRKQKKSGLEVESSFFWRPNRGSIAVIDNHSEDRFGSGNVEMTVTNAASAVARKSHMASRATAVNIVRRILF
jgi:hypothetical protein